MKALLAAVLAFVSLCTADAWAQPAPLAPAALVRTPHVTAELLPETAGVAPGGTLHLALRQQIKPGWHTYWRNPGDSGEATDISWSLPAGWRAGPIVWPAPERQVIAPLVNYGYENRVLLPVPITAPADARVGDTVRLTARTFWLVCEQVCVPEQATLFVDLPVVAGPAAVHPEHGRTVRAAMAAAPKPAGLTATSRLEAGTLKLAVTGAALSGADLTDAYFFPFSGSLIDHAAVQTVERGPRGLTLSLTPSPTLQPSLSEPVGGVLVAGEAAWEVQAPSGPALAGAAGLGPPSPRGKTEGGGLGLPLALSLALLGGLVLNLMPCVFPVLAMKAAALAGHAHESRTARINGLAFGAGVLATFLLLAAALLAARAAGQAVGWGFQLQSPSVVAALALLTLLVGLNLSGVFAIGGGSVQSAGSDLASRGGPVGAFFTGALAVVVAAPCTAPFMGLAMGWAMVQPALTTLLVFAALAIGFAAPFVALSFAPGLLRRLPRPGPWMRDLQRLLAWPMYAASAWLAWVFGKLVGTDGLGLLLAAGVLAGFVAALPVRRGGRTGAAALGAALIAIAGAGLLLHRAVSRTPDTPNSATAPQAASAGEPWSPERLASLRAEGRPVFVNFTADWCVTCKVNERLALSSRRVSEAFTKAGVVYLEADWTRRDPVIAAALAQHGRSGVPLYLIYPADGGAPAVLPQLLTERAIMGALDRAGPSVLAAQPAGGGVAGPGGEVITSTLSLSR